MRGHNTIQVLNVVIWLLSCLNAETIALKHQLKATNVSMLIFIPKTGDEPRIGDACQLASHLVVDAINSRPDILPGYNIVPIYRDEGPSGVFGPRASVEFQRLFEGTGYDENHAIQSPVMVGPFYSQGCKAASPLVHLLYMSHIGVGCNTPQLTENRKVYPNIFRTRAGGEPVIYPQLRFIREIGKWRRFGILTYTANVLDYTMAVILEREALANGFEVSFFDIVSTIDEEAVRNLKESDIRVTVFQVTLPPIVLAFLCEAYNQGMTGAKYSFILLYTAYIEAASLPNVIAKGCTRDIIWEQLKYSFWISWSAATDQPLLASSLGYNQVGFDKMFDQALLSLGKTERPADYDRRLLCHDSVLQAVIAMDSAEKKMNQTGTFSFNDMVIHPVEVMKLVNTSMAEVEFTGLRIGKFKYSPRVELDDDVYVVVQWTASSKRQVLYTYRRKSDAPVYNYSSYTDRRKLSEPLWFTENGQPSNDEQRIQHNISKVPIPFLCVICFLAVSLLCSSLVIVIKIALNGKTKPYLVQVAFLTLGCVLFDIAAIAFSLDVNLSAVCPIQYILILFGLAFMQGGLFFRLFYSKVMMGNPLATHTGQTLAVQSRLRFSTDYYRRQNKFLAAATSVILIFSTVYVAIFFPLHPMRVVVRESSLLYDAKTDTSTVAEVSLCKLTDNFDAEYLTPLVVGHGILFLLGCYFAYNLRYWQQNSSAHPDLTLTRRAITHLTTLVLGTILLVAVLTRWPIGQMVVISVLTLMASLIMSVEIYWMLIRSHSQSESVSKNVNLKLPNRIS